MSNSGLLENKVEKKIPEDFCWKSSPAVQRVLDVIAGIIAKEYIRVAKEKPEVFCEGHKGDSHEGRDSHLCANSSCSGGNR